MWPSEHAPESAVEHSTVKPLGSATRRMPQDSTAALTRVRRTASSHVKPVPSHDLLLTITAIQIRRCEDGDPHKGPSAVAAIPTPASSATLSSGSPSTTSMRNAESVFAGKSQWACERGEGPNACRSALRRRPDIELERPCKAQEHRRAVRASGRPSNSIRTPELCARSRTRAKPQHVTPVAAPVPARAASVIHASRGHLDAPGISPLRLAGSSGGEEHLSMRRPCPRTVYAERTPRAHAHCNAQG